MGKCFSSESPEQFPEIHFNEFFYLCRELKYLIRVAPDKISKLKYDKLIKIRSDSGVGYLNDGRIILGGGTDSSGCLTSKVYLLDPAKSKVSILPSMPVQTKEGTFFHYKEFAYFIGGVIDSEDEILAQEQAAPIMKYYLNTGNWEIFDEGKKKPNLIKKHFEELVDEDENECLSYTDILYPGMFMIGSRVYFVNGQKTDSKGILKMMDTVFSVDLEDLESGLRVEEFKSPLNVFRPVCGSYSKTAFITGGLLYESKKFSKDSYLINFEHESPEFTNIKGLKIDADDTYPVIGTYSSFITIHFPFFAVYDRPEKKWLQFEIEKCHVNRQNISYITQVMQLEQLEKKSVIKTKANLKTNGIFKPSSEKVETSEQESSLENSLHIKLPPGLFIDEGFEQDNLDSPVNSSSSNTFSVEKRIPLPDAFTDQVRPSSSSSNKNQELEARESFKLRPNANQMPLKNNFFGNLLSPKEEDGISKIFISKNTIPQFSDSDSITGNQIRKRSLSGSSSESFQEEDFKIKQIDSESSISSVSSVKPEKPMAQRLAPIRTNINTKKKLSDIYSFSQESSSESFNYDDNPDINESSSDSRV